MMFKKKIFYSLLCFSLVFLSIFSSTITFAKYSFTKSGIAFTIDFTKYKLLETVHTITAPGVSSGKLYGAEGSFKIPTAEELLNMSKEEYDAIVENIKKVDSTISLPSYDDIIKDEDNDGKSDAYDTFINSINNSSLNDTTNAPSSYTGHYYFSQSQFNSYLGDSSFQTNNPYSISNIDDVVFNVSNDTGNDLLLCFKIHYYCSKANDSANSVSFALYNTTLRGESIVYTDEEVLKGEFPIKYEEGWVNKTYYVEYFKETIPNVIGHRTGEGCEVVDDTNANLFYNGEEYYPCYGDINPYEIKIDPDLSEEKIKALWGTDIKYVSGENSVENIDTKFDLSDFIIPATGEIYSYNMSLFYGENYGSNTGAGYAFLAGIEMYTIPVTDEMRTL